jgi:hypothetical protein
MKNAIIAAMATKIIMGFSFWQIDSTKQEIGLCIGLFFVLFILIEAIDEALTNIRRERRRKKRQAERFALEVIDLTKGEVS